MTDLKFDVLKKIYSLSSQDLSSCNRKILVHTLFELYDENDLLHIKQAIRELRSNHKVAQCNDLIWLTSDGIHAMENEEQARVQQAFEEKQAKLDRLPQWLSFVASAVAVIISIIALIKAW